MLIHMVTLGMLVSSVNSIPVVPCDPPAAEVEPSGTHPDSEIINSLPDLPSHDFFRLEFVNDVKSPITIWLEGSQPPCSYDHYKTCNTWERVSDYGTAWDELADIFRLSGTVFQKAILNVNNTWDLHNINVSNSVDLKINEALLITPPTKDSKPDWSFSNREGNVTSPGTKAWVTKQGVIMPSSQRVSLIEYNIGEEINWDLSAVDGVNFKGSMSYGEDIRAIRTPINNCLYKLDDNNTCVNLKFSDDDSVFNGENVVEKFASEIWKAAGNPTNQELADAASGDSKMKQAYHVYWSLDPHARAYKRWLQRDTDNYVITNAYCWAYDEMTWVFGQEFSKNGDPVKEFDNEGHPIGNTNTIISADVTSDFKLGTSMLVVLNEIV